MTNFRARDIVLALSVKCQGEWKDIYDIIEKKKRIADEEIQNAISDQNPPLSASPTMASRIVSSPSISPLSFYITMATFVSYPERGSSLPSAPASRATIRSR